MFWDSCYQILKLLTNHQVLIEKGQATGVELTRGGATHTIRAAREVILSAGAIGSPHLLLLSGIGPRDQLQKFGVTRITDREPSLLAQENSMICSNVGPGSCLYG